jgi:nucleotide sugar dehydrogenase
MNNAVVIGGSGVIGNATRLFFNIKDQWSRSIQTLTMEEVGKKKWVFICVPTPARNSIHDISIIHDTIAEIQKYGDPLIVVRSTTTPGQLDKLSEEFHTDKIIHFPEFLTMATWKEDTMNPDIIVIGGRNCKHVDKLEKIVKKILGFKNPKYFKTNLTTSELIKCSINNFYALKVIFANEIFDYAKKVDANYTMLKEAMYSRKWIGGNHFDVIFKGKRGVRGPCLPKELEAMVVATGSPLLKAAKEINDKLI